MITNKCSLLLIVLNMVTLCLQGTADTDRSSAVVTSHWQYHPSFRNTDKVFYAIISGSGKVDARLLENGSAMKGNAWDLRFSTGKGMTVWLKTTCTIPSQATSLSYWLLSRSRVKKVEGVFELPDGRICSYPAPRICYDFWTRRALALPDTGDAARELGHNPASGKCIFRGWILTLPAGFDGKLCFGEIGVNTTHSGNAAYSWSVRDVDETNSWRGSYCGFRVSYEEVSEVPSVPIMLLTNQDKNPAKMAWQITDEENKIIDGGNIDLSKCMTSKYSSLALPVLPVGNYWLRIKTFGKTDDLRSCMLLSYLVRKNFKACQINQYSGAPFDSFGPNEATLNAAYNKSDGTIVIKVKNTGRAKNIKWNLINALGKHVEDGNIPFPRSNTSTNITIPVKSELKGPELYKLKLKASDGDIVKDERTCLVMVNGKLSPPNLGGNFPPISAVWLKETDYRSLLSSQDQGFNSFINYIKDHGASAFACSYWDELEPLKGFYQFRILDRRLKTAAAAKVPIFLTLWAHMDHLPSWLWYDEQIDQGYMARLYDYSYIRHYTLASKRTVDAYIKTIRTIVARYKDEKAIAGWNFSQGIETMWSDSATNRYICDYSDNMATVLGAQPPQPIFSDQLDLRPAWLKFEAVKQALVGKTLERTFRAVRELDKVKEICQYAVNGSGDPNLILPLFKKYKATICFGAGESMFCPVMESLCAQAGVAIDTEPSGVPPHGHEIMTTLFNKLGYGAWSGGINIQWGRYYSKHHMATINTVRKAKKLLDIFNRIGTGSTVVESGLAIGLGVKSLINHSRSFMWGDWAQMNTYQFGEIWQFAAKSYQNAFVTDSSSMESLKKYAAIYFLESPVMNRNACKRLIEYVRSGGKLILQGKTGKYDSEGNETWLLKKTFNRAFGTGAPEPYGAGMVQWIREPVTGRNIGDLKDMIAWTGCKPPVEIKASPQAKNIKVALRRLADKKTLCLVVYWKDKSRFIPDNRSKRKKHLASIMFSKTGLRKKWRITDMTDDASSATATSLQLSTSGLNVLLAPGEIKLIRLDAIP